MLSIDPIYTANMNDQQRAWFHAEYERARKDEVVGVLLAVFLGGLGFHHFYLRRDGLGILYLVFCWTGIPMILGWIECFLMPGRVRRYNSAQAFYIASRILGSTAPATPSSNSVTCNACSRVNEPGATFCRHCGAAIHGNHLATQPAI